MERMGRHFVDDYIETSIFEGQPPDQNKGHLGSRYIYIIYIHIYTHAYLDDRANITNHNSQTSPYLPPATFDGGIPATGPTVG